jgi:hypothetical protein
VVNASACDGYEVCCLEGVVVAFGLAAIAAEVFLEECLCASDAVCSC